MIRPPYGWKESLRMGARRFGPTPPRRDGPLDGRIRFRTAESHAWIGLVGDLGPTFGKPVQVADEVVRFLADCAAMVGNLEGVVTDASWRPYRQPIGEAIFDLLEVFGPLDRWSLSLANNHALDFGRAALRESARRCEHRGLGWFGLRERPREEILPGVTVTSWTWWLNDPHDEAVLREDPGCPDDPGLHLAYPHWGYEHERRPREDQRRRLPSRYDAVLGHHSHLPQPVQRMEDDRLVAWSLGNFVTGKYLAKLGEGLVLKLGLHRPEGGGGPVITEARFRHLRIERPVWPAECRIRFLT